MELLHQVNNLIIILRPVQLENTQQLTIIKHKTKEKVQFQAVKINPFMRILKTLQICKLIVFSTSLLITHYPKTI